MTPVMILFFLILPQIAMPTRRKSERKLRPGVGDLSIKYFPDSGKELKQVLFLNHVSYIFLPVLCIYILILTSLAGRENANKENKRGDRFD